MLRVLAIFILLSSTSLRVFAQLEESELKTALVFKFAQMLEWKNKDQIKTYNIGVYCEDTLLLNRFRTLSRNVKIHSKPVKIFAGDDIPDITDMQCVFIDYDRRHQIVRVANAIESLPVLLIAYNAPKPELTMINIYMSEDNNTLKYKINRESLDKHGFRYNNNLLLFGGNMGDVQKLYISANKQLKQKTKELDSINSKLLVLKQRSQRYQAYIDSVTKEIKTKESSLEVKEDEIQVLNTNISKKDSKLNVLTKELETQHSQKERLLADIKNKKDSIKIVGQQLRSMNDQLELKKHLVNSNQEIINKQKKEIKQQRNALYWALVLTIAFLVAAISIYLAWKTKRSLADKLKQLVDERTSELNKSHKYYQSLFENTPVAILEFDLSELVSFIKSLGRNDSSGYDALSGSVISEALNKVKVNDANLRALQLLNASDKKEFTENFHSFFDGRSIPGAKTLIENLASGKEQFENEIIFLSLDGSYKNFIQSVIVLPEDKSSYSKVLVSMLDITELRMYEQELMKHRDHLEELVEERSKEILKLNADLNNTNKELISTNKQLKEQHEELLSTLDQLNKTQKQLIESEKMASLGMLTAGIAHEINNPLNFISSGNQALELIFNDFWQIIEDIISMVNTSDKAARNKLKEMVSQIDDNEYHKTIREIIGNISMGVDRVDEIVNSLKSYSQSSDTSSQYNIVKGIENSLIILRNKYWSRIKIIKQFDEDIPDLFCPPGKLDQVFINVFANAFDAIEDEGTVNISLSHDNGNVNIIIKDSGIGIRNANLNKLFDPFYTTKEPGKGTGLGLYITYGIIKQLKGDISFDSEPGKGTTVKITLPVG